MTDPRHSLRHEGAPRAEPVLAAAISIAATTAGPFLLLARQQGVHLPCTMRDLAGLPCPFCGITRAAAGIAGDITALSPVLERFPAQMLVLVLAGMAIYATALLVRQRRLPSEVPARLFLAAVPVLLAWNWSAQIRTL